MSGTARAQCLFHYVACDGCNLRSLFLIIAGILTVRNFGSNEWNAWAAARQNASSITIIWLHRNDEGQTTLHADDYLGCEFCYCECMIDVVGW
jgi:hypothetical protein